MMDDPLHERRSRLRFELAYETVCRIPPQKDYPNAVSGQVSDISTTGLSFLTEARLVSGDELSATVEAEMSGAKENVVLAIVHVTALTTGEFFVGARFLAPMPLGAVDRFVTRTR